MKNILSYVERTALQYPEHIAIGSSNSQLTYQTLLSQARQTGSLLAAYHYHNQPIAIFMDKCPACVSAMLGIAYSGNFYVVLDSLMPVERVQRIFETLHPVLVLTDEIHKEIAEQFSFDGDLLLFEQCLETEVNENALLKIREQMTETDPLYALYTSGSTGQPKGTVISHRAVIAYSEWYIDAFGINETTIFGSQTPFYFSMSVSDLFSTLRTGARLQIIPKEMFSFPLQLIEYMNTYMINTIYWVPSALSIVANWNTFAYAKPEYLKKVLFAGEVMPNKQLNYWRSAFPNLLYANLFGPTETTDICTYYIVNRSFADDETLPIGRSCDNCDAFIVDEEGHAAATGELFVRSPFLADGYYNNPEKTKAAFVQNPLNKAYPEIVYATGDLVTYNDYQELIYLGRKDFQIKHMGYRIELGEIEASVSALEGVNACVCIFDLTEDKIVLLYQGKAKTEKLFAAIQTKLPAYMHPGEVIRLKAMPYNANGKIDRNYLKNNYKNLR